MSENKEDLDNTNERIENLQGQLLRIFEQEEVDIHELSFLITSFIPYIDNEGLSYIDESIIEEMGLRNLQSTKEQMFEGED